MSLKAVLTISPSFIHQAFKYQHLYISQIQEKAGISYRRKGFQNTRCFNSQKQQAQNEKRVHNCSRADILIKASRAITFQHTFIFNNNCKCELTNHTIIMYINFFFMTFINQFPKNLLTEAGGRRKQVLKLHTNLASVLIARSTVDLWFLHRKSLLLSKLKSLSEGVEVC